MHCDELGSRVGSDSDISSVRLDRHRSRTLKCVLGNGSSVETVSGQSVKRRRLKGRHVYRICEMQRRTSRRAIITREILCRHLKHNTYRQLLLHLNSRSVAVISYLCSATDHLLIVSPQRCQTTRLIHCFHQVEILPYRTQPSTQETP